MSTWWRFYNETIMDPKIIRLSDELYRAWTILLCFASKNGGVLPPADDIATALRMKTAKVAEWITKLSRAGLIDDAGGEFVPHNWAGRQYTSNKSDPTNAARQKRYRERRRNTVTTVTHNDSNDVMAKRPDTDTDTDTDQNPEPNGSGADAPLDYRAELFGRGLKSLGQITGKGSDACRSFVGKCLKAAGDDAVVVLGLIEDAERNRVADPSAWIAARLKSGPPSVGRPLTDFQQKQKVTNDVREMLRSAGSRGGGAIDRFLSDDHGQRSDGVRGGIGADIFELSAAPCRKGG